MKKFEAKIMLNEKDIRYGYFQVKTATGIGYICAAILRPPKNSGGEHKVAFSYCSPKDIFIKNKARKIAHDRLEKWRSLPEETKKLFNPRISFVPFGTNTKDKIVDALYKVIKEKKAPTWVIKNYKNICCGLRREEFNEQS